MKDELKRKYRKDIEQLFPIKVPDNLINVMLDFDNCSVRLLNLLNDHGIRTINKLDGKLLDYFLEMRGFGDICLRDLIDLLKSINPASSENILDSSEAVGSVSDSGKTKSKSINDYITKDNLLLLQVLNIIRNELDDRQREIFDHRIFPKDGLLTLDELGEKFNLTRERVRQLEKGITKRIRHESYYPGVYFRRRIVDIFSRERKINLFLIDLLRDGFFYGCPIKYMGTSPVERFIKKVFPETFSIDPAGERIELISKHYLAEFKQLNVEPENCEADRKKAKG